MDAEALIFLKICAVVGGSYIFHLMLESYATGNRIEPYVLLTAGLWLFSFVLTAKAKP